MFTLRQATSVRADACTNHRISLSGLWPDEAEKICLLAEILGWQTSVAKPPGEGTGGAKAGVAFRAGAEPSGRLSRADLIAYLAAPDHPARLVLRQIGTVIRVEADDPGVRRQLARQGLDRLVAPVPLMALEQLLMFAS